MKTRTFPRNQVKRAIDFERAFKESMRHVASKDDALRQLANDINRKSITIDGYLPDESDELWKKANQLVAISPNMPTEEFEIVLTRFLKSKGYSDANIDQLFHHYSQQPTYGPKRVLELMQEGDQKIMNDETQSNLFLENGKIYCSAVVTRIYIKDLLNSNNRLREFEGTAGAVYTLTDQGFKFKEFTSTGDVTTILEKNLMIMLAKELSMTVQVDHIWHEVSKLFPHKNQRNEFLQKLCEYQIDHISEIFAAQLKLAAKAQEKIILEEAQTYRDFLNKQKPGMGDELYKDKKTHSPELRVWDERYKKVIVPQQAEEQVKQQASANIAYNLLISIQDMIFSSTWQLGTFGGVEVSNQDGSITNVVPKNMVKILAVIDNAFKKDKSGNTMVWLDALNEAALIGRNAAENIPFKLFGARDAATQEFYDHFVKAYENRDKSQGRHRGKKK